MEIIKQLYHSGSLNSFNANWLPQHRGWAARLVVNQRQKGIGPAAALRSTNHNRQHQCSQLGCLSAAGFHGTMGTFWRSHCKRKHKAAKSARRGGGWWGLCIAGSNDTTHVLFNREKSSPTGADDIFTVETRVPSPSSACWHKTWRNSSQAKGVLVDF